MNTFTLAVAFLTLLSFVILFFLVYNEIRGRTKRKPTDVTGVTVRGNTVRDDGGQRQLSGTPVPVPPVEVLVQGEGTLPLQFRAKVVYPLRKRRGYGTATVEKLTSRGVRLVNDAGGTLTRPAHELRVIG